MSEPVNFVFLHGGGQGGWVWDETIAAIGAQSGGAARCLALLHGHPGVHPEDVKAVFPAVAGHRLQARPGSPAAVRDPARLVLESVPIP